jgi:predicted anti-sigma-YlaC factor YlaD
MNCKQVNQFLADYLDGSLPWRQRVAFKLHLLICRHCRRYLASYKATVRVAGSLGRADEPQVPDELVRAILAVRRGTTDNAPDGRSPDSDE